MPLQVSREAKARATWPSGSRPSAVAISLHGWPSAAAACGPISALNSSESTVKRLIVVHLPDEAKRLAAFARRSQSRLPRLGLAGVRRGRLRLIGGVQAAGWRRAAGRFAGRDLSGRRFGGGLTAAAAPIRRPPAAAVDAPEPMRRSKSGRSPCSPSACPAASAVAASGRGAERGEAFGAAKPGPRRRRCVQQRAVGRKQRHRLVAAGEQTLRLLRRAKDVARRLRLRSPGWPACDRRARSASRCTSARRPCVRRNRAAAPAAAPRHAAACRRAARSAARPSPWGRWCGRSVRWTMRR